jgi:hypothetical protein
VITADQLLAHAIGDYVLQSDWMANEKTKQSFAAACHAVFYTLPFLIFRPSYGALMVICGTHFIIDRWRLARYVVYTKNFLSPRPWSAWAECSGTGYHNTRPPWMAVWLLIIADNVMHVAINGLALRYL